MATQQFTVFVGERALFDDGIISAWKKKATGGFAGRWEEGMVLNPIQAYTIMFFTGGFVYCGIEILYRGFSHISMLFAGGICFLLVGVVENLLGESASIVAQMLVCSLMITAVEFIFGWIVNRQMHLNVWDYSGEQYNIKGQICLLNSNLWFLLSGPAIFLYDFMRYLLLGIHLPHYKIF